MHANNGSVAGLRRMWSGRGGCTGLALILALNVSALSAQTVYVDGNTGDDARTGLDDWTNAVKTISNGVAKAGVSGTVLVATGTYNVVTNIVITSGITLMSWNVGALDPVNTIIDGQGVARCLSLNNAAARASGFTLRNGNGQGNYLDYGGGAVLINSGGTLSNCHVVNNLANQYGGGVYLGSVNAYVENCIIEQNVVTNEAGARGGGVYIAGGGGTLRNSTLACNTNLSTGVYAGGGGVYVRGDGADGRCHVIGCVISNNQANSGGGALGYRWANLISNTIVNNLTVPFSYSYGGGVLLYGIRQGSILAHNTVSGNTASVSGGGVFIWVDSSLGLGGVLVSNCAVIDNVATSFGGGVYSYIASPAYTNAQVLVTHCDISGNRVIASSSNPGQVGGAGVYWDAPGRFENCIIANNAADGCTAGGMYLRRIYATYSYDEADELILRNCLVASNQSLIGGGVYVRSCGTNKAVRLENCTVAANVATNYAGGVWFHDSTNATMTNTIAYHNSAPVDENIRTNNAEYALGYCCVTPTNHLSLAGALVNVTTNDPAFAGWETGDFRLTSGSPGVNAGFEQAWALLPGAVDLDGRPRLDRLSRRVDLGCYEHILRGTIFGFR